jgi:hypothetical protein
MRREGIYLAEGGSYVGPFHSRGDAERFMVLMALFGGSPEGIEIVYIKPHASGDNSLACEASGETRPVFPLGLVH